MLAGSYLLVITERECVGSYLGHPIYKVSSLKVFSCDPSAKYTRDEKVTLLIWILLFDRWLAYEICDNIFYIWQKKMESEFYTLLKVAEKTPGLYFSYDVNITLRSIYCLYIYNVSIIFVVYDKQFCLFYILQRPTVECLGWRIVSASSLEAG